jgi:hypothetical protein
MPDGRYNGDMTAQGRQASPDRAVTVDEKIARVAQGIVRVQDFFWPPLPLEMLEACTADWLRGDDADGTAGSAPCRSR